MKYLKLNGNDYSHLVSNITVTNTLNYNAQTNAAGNTVVDIINKKRSINVSFIPMSAEEGNAIKKEFDTVAVVVEYYDLDYEENANSLQSAICLCPQFEYEYLMLLDNKQMINSFELEFTEL